MIWLLIAVDVLLGVFGFVTLAGTIGEEYNLNLQKWCARGFCISVAALAIVNAAYFL